MFTINLTKLSLSNNKIENIGSLEFLKNLKELKLNNNRIKKVAQNFPISLAILDLGNNQIMNLIDAGITQNNDENDFYLSKLFNLINLNFVGNPVCKVNDYKKTILSVVPQLRVLDGERFDEKFLFRKRKKEIELEIVQTKEKNSKFKQIRLNDFKSKSELIPKNNSEVKKKEESNKCEVKEIKEDYSNCKKISDDISNNKTNQNQNSIQTGLVSIYDKKFKKSEILISKIANGESISIARWD